MISTKKKLVITCFLSIMFTVISMSIYAKDVGEQPSVDVETGAGKKEVNDTGRTTQPKEVVINRRTEGADGRVVENVTTPPSTTVLPNTTVIPDATGIESFKTTFNLVFTNPTIPPNRMSNPSYYNAQLDIQKSPRVSLYSDGIGALINANEMRKDFNTIFSAVDIMQKYEKTLKPGETKNVLVSATPEGKVSILEITDPKGHVITDGKSKSFSTTITRPPIVTVPYISEEQELKELNDYIKALTEEEKIKIREYRKKYFLPPLL